MGKERHFVVLEKRNDSVLVELMEPEDEAGGVRRFTFVNFREVFEWNGDPTDSYFYEDDDDDDDDDWDSEYVEDEENESYW